MAISVNIGVRAEVMLTQTLDTGGGGWWVWMLKFYLIGECLAFVAANNRV